MSETVVIVSHCTVLQSLRVTRLLKLYLFQSRIEYPLFLSFSRIFITIHLELKTLSSSFFPSNQNFSSLISLSTEIEAKFRNIIAPPHEMLCRGFAIQIIGFASDLYSLGILERKDKNRSCESVRGGEDIRAEWAGREDNDQRIYSGSEVGDPARSKRKPNKLAGRWSGLDHRKNCFLLGGIFYAARIGWFIRRSFNSRRTIG